MIVVEMIRLKVQGKLTKKEKWQLRGIAILMGYICGETIIGLIQSYYVFFG